MRFIKSMPGEMPCSSGACRVLSAEEVHARRDARLLPALRLRVRPGCVGFQDLVYGRIEIEAVQISDPAPR